MDDSRFFEDTLLLLQRKLEEFTLEKEELIETLERERAETARLREEVGLLQQELALLRHRLHLFESSRTGRILRFWSTHFEGTPVAETLERLADRVLRGFGGHGGHSGGQPPEHSRFHARKELEAVLSRHPDRRGIIFLPHTVSWNVPLHQRPHQMAARLAALGYLFFFWEPFFAPVQGARYFKKVKEGIYLTNQQDLLLETPEPLVIDFYSTSSAEPDFLAKLDRRHCLIYEYIDHIDESISGEVAGLNRIRHRSIRPDAVLASAQVLFDEMVERLGPENVFYCPNGVDYDHFHVLRNPHDIPGDMKRIIAEGKPVVGYFGALAQWLDYDILNRVARERRDLNFVYIGVDYDGSLKALHRGENVHFLGKKPYPELPRYGTWFDVAVIPFSRGEIADTTSPIKLFEYMALGKPIVTTDMKECKRYRSVLWAGDAQGFMDALDRALRLREDSDYLALVDREARENTWDARAELFDRVVREILRRKAGNDGPHTKDQPGVPVPSVPFPSNP